MQRGEVVTRVLPRLLVSLIVGLAFTTTTAHAQSFLLNNGGSISYFVSGPQQLTSCPPNDPPPVESRRQKWTYSNFSYGDPTLISLGFGAGSTYVIEECDGSWTLGPSVWLTNVVVTAEFDPQPDESASLSNVSITGSVGWIKPKYSIIGIEYAPPGSSSSVMYAQNTVVGSSVSTSSSFTDSQSSAISLSFGGKIFGFGDKVTSTYSQTRSQGTQTSSSVAVSQTTSSSTSLSGYTDPTNGTNHDYDYIFLWLNPVAAYAVSNVNSFNEWLGYGYNLQDTRVGNDMDVIGIQVGCLNGDFQGDPSLWATCQSIINGPLARTWAATNVDGSGPALTSADLTAILHADPFYTTYTPTLAPGSFTTTDGRFTECHATGCDETIDFEPNLTYGFSQGYSTTDTSSQTATFSFSQTFSVDSQFTGGSGFWAGFSADLKNSNTFTSEYVFSQSTNNSNGQTSSFSVVGPPEGYTGPSQFVVWQDNLYGTFMFFPVQ